MITYNIFEENIILWKGDLYMRKVFLRSCLLILLLFANVVNVNATSVVPEGYTPIYTIADLYAINNDLDGNYILMNDIDMSEATAEGGDWNLYGYGWTPINDFAGVFDGNGYRIVGMNIYGTLPYNNRNVGFFGETVEGATIKNLALVDINIDIVGTTDLHVGGIVGLASYDDSISNCSVTGNINVKIEENNDYAYEYAYIGGLAGTAYNVTNCYNCCSINANCDEGGCAGGLIGYFPSSRLTMINCYNMGSVQGNLSYIGAIAGEGYYGEYDNCYYLSGTADNAVGDSYIDDEECIKYNVVQFKLSSCFIGWDFDTVWEIDPYCDYPYPQLQSNRHIRVKELELERMPTKLEYEQGDEIDLSGAALRITYEDDTSTLIALEEDMLVGLDMNKIGTQEVTVRYGDANVTFSILVKEVPVSSISLNQTDVVLYRSKSVQLVPTILPANASDKTIVWISSNETVAKVDANGNVTGKSKGHAVITATTNNGCVATANVTVLVASVSVQLSSNELTMKVGESSVLTAEIAPLDSTDTISWSSSDENIAKVVDGTIYANMEGMAIITAYTESGVSATCKVIVNKKEESKGDDAKKEDSEMEEPLDEISESQKKINSIKAQKVTIKSIKNKKSKKIVLKLSGKGNGIGYQIQYAKNKKFKSAKKVTKKTSTVTLSKLTKKKKYYVRVRVYGKVNGKIYYGKWSKVKSVAIKK